MTADPKGDPVAVPPAPESSRKGDGPGTLGRLHRLIRSNWISSLGAATATLAGLLELTAVFLPGNGAWHGPYVGVITVLILPLVALAGLLLIPFGLLIYRKQLASRVSQMTDRPMHLARAVVILTLINLAAVATAGQAGVKYLSSTEFCGKACHTVMEPEYLAFKDSHHSNIGCVTCHVGPGAKAFIETKINGASQMLGTIRNDYSRPIPTPVHNLPATKDMCVSCHSSTRYLGTKILVQTRFEENEANTLLTNVLLMRRGGEAPDGSLTGIHWHIHPSSKVEYLPGDERRTTIPWVRQTLPDGTVRVFRGEGYSGPDPQQSALRRMDCVDCHNRVGHPFQTADAAVDQLMAGGLISRTLPFLKKRAVAALRKNWSRNGARDGIRDALRADYGRAGLDPKLDEQLEIAVDRLTAVWLRNNYPDRKLGWDSYPSYKSHDGCFRCHDGKHKTESGKVITESCSVCHIVLSEKQRNPEMLKTLGISLPTK